MAINVQANVAEAVSTTAPDLLPEGPYEFYIYEATLSEYSDKSKNPGRPKLDLVLKVAEGPHAGRQVWEYNLPMFGTWSGGATAFTFYQFVAALGIEIPEDGNVSIPDPEFLVGERIKAKVYHDTYGDNTNAKVKKYLAQDASVEAVESVAPSAEPKKSKFAR